MNDQDFFYFTGGALDKGGRWTKGFTVLLSKKIVRATQLHVHNGIKISGILLQMVKSKRSTKSSSKLWMELYKEWMSSKAQIYQEGVKFTKRVWVDGWSGKRKEPVAE